MTHPPTHHGTPPDDAHARTWALLPWLVNGTASAVQRAQAEAHLADCADCREELHWQARLQSALQQSPAGLPDAEADEAAEAGLQRLMARLDSEAVAPIGDARPAAAAPAGDRSPGRGGHALTRWLAAAVVVQAVALGILGLGATRDEPAYRTLSESAAAPATQRPSWRVLPDAQLPLGQWQLLLQRHELQVVEGPNVAGAYGLAARAASAAGDPAATLERLRAEPAIRLAEPVQP